MLIGLPLAMGLARKDLPQLNNPSDQIYCGQYPQKSNDWTCPSGNVFKFRGAVEYPKWEEVKSDDKGMTTVLNAYYRRMCFAKLFRSCSQQPNCNKR